MSGKECFKVLDKIFVPKNVQREEDIKGYTIKYGHIIENGDIIDEVLVSYFKAPKSYTTENMCEINTHGGNILMKKILDMCLKNGARLAEPGEFTKRAFLNGRIDLMQAESVIDVINSKTEKEAKTSMKQLEGFLSKKIKDIKSKIMDVMVNIEVTIDYPEYDTPDVTEKELSDMLDSVEEKLEKLEKSFDNGKIIKEGIKTVIIGRPNAGKSSLLNAILKEDRAIVTQYEGTTRDTIEEFVTVNGIPLKLIDTAGIRDAKDEVEKIGIEKSKELVKEADLIIAIFDASEDLTKEDMEILDLIKDKKTIIILNKSDLQQKIVEQDERLTKVSSDIIKISALNKIGIEKIYDKITNILEKHGYLKYELSNFSYPNYESKHNLVYWNNQNYYGFGLGASGYLKNERYENTKSLTEYLKGNYILNKYSLTKDEIIQNEFILGFRKIKGINKKNFQKKYQININLGLLKIILLK